MRIPLNPSPRVGIRTCSDYSPFGVELDGRTVSNYGYRFGYQGSEKDNEFKGDGNSYTTEFRQLDPRLGRWLSVDPVIQPWQSTYCAMDDNPLFFYDKKGDSSVWDKKGYMIHYDPNDKDLRAYMLNKGKLKYIGTLGGEIKADIWFKNLLKQNSQIADDIWSPLTFKSYVQQYGIWDYKYASPANPNSNAKQHILGVAFYRKDKTNGLGDLPDTYFIFDGKKGRAEDLNNFHFGVVGDAYGVFDEKTMLKLAGEAEMDKWKSEGKQVPLSWRPTEKVLNISYYGGMMGSSIQKSEELKAPYGDNPIDHNWIKKGFAYYNKERKNLDGDDW
jgi:RHS repeat-associated protein